MLYRVVNAHLGAFLDAAAEGADGTGLPAFIEQEFQDFLTCDVLAHGFARLRCGECALERLVPFSCKGRGFCPSCGGRRMTESAARLVDHVLPRVPVRQWVLSLPYRLRYLLAWNHDLCRAVLSVSSPKAWVSVCGQRFALDSPPSKSYSPPYSQESMLRCLAMGRFTFRVDHGTTRPPADSLCVFQTVVSMMPPPGRLVALHAMCRPRQSDREVTTRSAPDPGG